MVLTVLCASFVGAFVVSFAMAHSGSRVKPLPTWPTAVPLGGVTAVASLLAAFDLVSWEAVAFAGGLGAGLLSGQWLGAPRARSPG
jgi:hypothetical protein